MRKLRRNSLASLVVSVIAVVIALAALSVGAQVKGTGQVLGKSQRMSAADGDSAAWQTREHERLPRGSNAGRASVPRLQMTRNSAGRRTGDKPLFLPPTSYDTGGENAIAIAVADVDGSGEPDLIVTNECASPNCATSSVGVLLGNGDGTFQPVITSGPAGYLAVASAVADLNGDGKPDLIVANYLSSSVTVWIGNGNGTFLQGETYDSGGIWAKAVTIADLNADGKPDLVVGNAAGNGASNRSVSILLGNGDGTFQGAIAYDSAGTTISSIAATDVNGDGRPDLLVIDACAGGNCANGGTVAVLVGNGDGTFQSALTYGSGAQDPGSIAVADVNRDSKPDLLVANATSVGVLFGAGDGTFQPAVTYNSGGGGSIRVADVDGDGRQDMLMVGGTSVFVLQGNPDGTFQSPLTFDSGGRAASSLAIGDLRGNGKLDLAVADLLGCDYCKSASAGILLNNSPAPESTTTTSLGSSPNPSVFGQSVTFTAQVSSSSGTPTGTVRFQDGTAILGSASLANGATSITVSTLLVGSHAVTAEYLGDGNFDTSVSNALNQVVDAAATTTYLASSRNPAKPGQKVTYTADVTGQYGGPVAGTVTFSDAGLPIATVTLANNRAAYSTSYQSIGIHPITATYSGDGNNSGSQSSTLTEYIEYPTKTSLATSGSPTYVGQPVTFTATVTSMYGQIPDGHLVTFYDGTTAMASVPVAGQTASYTTPLLSAKTHIIDAKYAGDNTFAPSSGKVKQVVNKYPTTTTLNSSPNPSNFGETVTFTATVTPSGPYAVTGKVKFFDGATGIGSAALNGGVATLKKSTLAAGTHAITAQYLSDSYNDRSTSAVVNQVVK